MASGVPSLLVVDSPYTSALEETYDTSISSSTEITLNSATKYIECTAIDQAVFMKWGTTDVSSSDWDHVIPIDTTRVFKVPSGTTAVNFIQQTATAILAMAEF